MFSLNKYALSKHGLLILAISVFGACSSHITSQERTPASRQAFEVNLPRTDSSLTFYVIPPPRLLSWESPQALTRTTVLSSIHSDFHSIGHITTQVTCKRSDGSNVAFWTGMRSSSGPDLDDQLLFKDEIGLGIIFYPFPGEQEEGDMIFQNLLEARERKTDRLFSIRFLISPEHCDRLDDYHKAYSREVGGKWYGSAFHPRLKQGGGCTEYATSYLDVAGLMSDEYKKAWSKTILVPVESIGKKERHVSIKSIIFGNRFSRWAHPSEEHRKLVIYDTQFMKTWAKKLIEQGKDFERDVVLEKYWKTGHYELSPGIDPTSITAMQWQSNGYFGIVIDKRDTPAAQDDFFKSEM